MPNDSKLFWNILSAPRELPGSLAAVHSSCVNCLPAASPATRDHRRPQPQGPWQVGPESRSSLVPQHGPPVSLVGRSRLRSQEESGPRPPPFLPAAGVGRASSQKGTQGTSPVPTRPPSGPTRALRSQRVLFCRCSSPHPFLPSATCVLRPRCCPKRCRL